MRSLPPINMETTIRSLSRILVVVLLLTLAWRGAGWLWYISAPAPSPRIPDLRGLVGVAHVARFPWFGTPKPSFAATPVSDIRVIGIFAGGKRPTALLVIGTQNPIAAAIGETLAPELKLISVANDHVVVLRNGASEKIMLTRSVVTAQQAGNQLTPGQFRLKLQ